MLGIAQADPGAWSTSTGWAGSRAHRLRLLVWSCAVAACAGAGLLGGDPAAAGWDADLVRLMRFMALLKGCFAITALAACTWRLARPAAFWREAVYVVGPALMMGGAISLWRLHSVGVATIVLHAGMFSLLAAAVTDQAFIPARSRRMAMPDEHGKSGLG